VGGDRAARSIVGRFLKEHIMPDGQNPSAAAEHDDRISGMMGRPAKPIRERLEREAVELRNAGRHADADALESMLRMEGGRNA
jgi:hypothetical protein